MRSKVSFLLAATLLALSVAAYGHHSFAATYHQDQTDHYRRETGAVFVS